MWYQWHNSFHCLGLYTTISWFLSIVCVLVEACNITNKANSVPLLLRHVGHGPYVHVSFIEMHTHTNIISYRATWCLKTYKRKCSCSLMGHMNGIPKRTLYSLFPYKVGRWRNDISPMIGRSLELGYCPLLQSSIRNKQHLDTP